MQKSSKGKHLHIHFFDNPSRSRTPHTFPDYPDRISNLETHNVGIAIGNVGNDFSIDFKKRHVQTEDKEIF